MKIIDIGQNSEAWVDARQGKITGTKLAGIVVKRGTKKKIGFYELLAERLSLPENTGEEAMARGLRLEEESIATFENDTGLKVETVGLCISDENPNIALSPDGLIKNDGKYTEAFETKSLSSAKHLMAYFEQGIPVEYEMQALQYFIVNEDLETLYFAFYDPRVNSLPFHYIKLLREDLKKDIETYTEYQENTLREIDEMAESIAF